MKARFPETMEQRAIRLARMVSLHATDAPSGVLESTAGPIPRVSVLEARIKARLAVSGEEAPPGLAEALAVRNATEGHRIATGLARGDLRVEDLDEGALANLESVIRVVGRPAWFIRQDAPVIGDGQEIGRDDEFWVVMITAARRALLDACSRAGCVMMEKDGTRTPVGTAWMIGKHTVITNAHVARLLALRNPALPATDPRGGWRLRPDRTGVVDFAFENVIDRSARFSIAQVLYVETADAPDLAVFRLAVSEGRPQPPDRIKLDLEQNRPQGWEDANVFTVGHPIADMQDDANVKLVFGPLDGTKRISPGKLTAVLGGSVLAHDCSTTNGSSGSPLIDFASLRAIGLHYFGRPGERNEAVFLATIASHPAIVKSQSGQWGV
jgi:hypothetical protein